MLDSPEDVISYLSSLPPESHSKPMGCLRAYQVLASGKSIAGVAVEFNTSESTIRTWRNHYPEFDNAMDLGNAAGRLYWENWAEQKAEEGVEYNARWYDQLMIARYGVTKDRKIRVAGLKANAKGTKNAQIIVNYVEDEQFTSKESREMMGFVKDMADIKIQSDLERRLEEAEKRIAEMARAL